MTYFKRVDATQLILSVEEIASLKGPTPINFLGYPIKPYGASYFCILLAGHDQIKVEATQWVVRHPEGHYEVLWPDQFEKNFEEGEQELGPLKIKDPFIKKSFNQPTKL